MSDVNDILALTVQPNELEIAECVTTLKSVHCDKLALTVRRLAFQVDMYLGRIAELEKALSSIESDMHGYCTPSMQGIIDRALKGNSP